MLIWLIKTVIAIAGTALVFGTIGMLILLILDD